MAGLALLDGTSANIDIMTSLTSAGTATNSLKCQASTVRYTFRKNINRRSTFCLQSWTTPIQGEKTMFAVVGGFMSVGTPVSDPLVLFTAAGDLPFILTAETGNTLQGKWVETEDDGTLGAGNNSGRTWSFESSGAVTSTWVIA